LCDKDSNIEVEGSGGISNNIKSQDASESESINQEELETELPPTLDIPIILPMNVTFGHILNDASVQQGVIDSPTVVPTTNVVSQVAAINSSNDTVSSSVMPSNPTPSVNTSISKSSTKAKPG
jgi:hypothetical protein